MATESLGPNSHLSFQEARFGSVDAFRPIRLLIEHGHPKKALFLLLKQLFSLFFAPCKSDSDQKTESDF